MKLSNSYTENWKADLASEVPIPSQPNKHLASWKADMPHIRLTKLHCSYGMTTVQRSVLPVVSDKQEFSILMSCSSTQH